MIVDSLLQILAVGNRPASKIAEQRIIVDTIAETWESGFPLPLRDFYTVFGPSAQISDSFSFFSLDSLAGKGDLVFCRFADETMENGVEESHRSMDDPPLRERTVGESDWFSGGRSLASGLINMTAWEVAKTLAYKKSVPYSYEAVDAIASCCDYIGGEALNCAYIYFRSFIWRDKPLLVCTYMTAEIVLASTTKATIDDFISQCLPSM